MSLTKKSSKPTLRIGTEDLSCCLDQKNAIISVLQAEVQELRCNQERYDRVREELYRAKAKYQTIIRDCQITSENNQERLQLTAKNVYELKIQISHIETELKAKSQALKEAKFGCQQLMECANRKQDEIVDIQIKWQQQKIFSEVKKMEEERTKMQVLQLREEVDKQKRENANIKKINDSTTVQKSHKTQSYIRNLLREETNLNENLTRVEDENNQLDCNISELDNIISIRKSDAANIDKDYQEIRFLIASKELEKKKYENQIREKTKLLSSDKEKYKSLCGHWEVKKAEVSRLQQCLGESSQEINFILSKNNEIQQVNSQLNEDLIVCQKHLENVSRVNKVVEAEIQQMQQATFNAIKKLQQPIIVRNLNLPVGSATGKWSTSSMTTHYETGDFCRVGNSE